MGFLISFIFALFFIYFWEIEKIFVELKERTDAVFFGMAKLPEIPVLFLVLVL